jgi:hypothetical protein
LPQCRAPWGSAGPFWEKKGVRARAGIVNNPPPFESSNGINACKLLKNINLINSHQDELHIVFRFYFHLLISLVFLNSEVVLSGKKWIVVDLNGLTRFMLLTWAIG